MRTRTANSDAAIEDRHSELVELRGKRLKTGLTVTAPVLTLSAVESMASGYASCNRYTGRYAIKSDNRIRLGRNMAVTMMACPDMSIESEFLDVLRMVDNYALGDDGMLSLNRARMAPIARFKQIDESE